MMPIVGGLVAPVALVAAGWGFASHCPGLREAGWAERVAYSFLFGLALTTLALFCLSFLFSMPLVPTTVRLTMAVIASCSLVLWLKAGKQPASLQLRRPELFWILCVLSVGIALIALGLTRPPDGFDYRMTWAAHARHMRQEQTVRPMAFEENHVYIVHPRYPPLTPLMQVVALDLLGVEDERVVTPVYACFWSVLILLVYGGARRAAGPLPSLLAASLPIGVSWFAVGEGGALSGYADLPLACFFGGAVVLTVLVPARDAGGLHCGLLVAAAVMSKNEGAALAVAFCAAALVRSIYLQAERLPFLRRVGVSAAIAAVALALLVVRSAEIPQRYDEAYAARFASSALLGGAEVVITEALPAILGVATTARWRWFVLSAALLLIVGWRAHSTSRGAPLASSWLVAVGAHLSAYATDPWPGELGHLVGVTWERLQLQVIVPFLILVALATERALRVRGRGRESFDR